MATRKKWSELSDRNRRLITILGVIEGVLLVATLVDIRRRPADQIKGSKRMWTAIAFVNIIGPIAYFVFGRRRGAGCLERLRRRPHRDDQDGAPPAEGRLESVEVGTRVTKSAVPLMRKPVPGPMLPGPCCCRA